MARRLLQPACCLLIALLISSVPANGAPPASQPATRPARARLVVAADGSGDFPTVQAAVDAIPDGNAGRVVIEVRPGTYAGRVRVPRGKPHVALAGTDPAHPERTVLTFDVSARTPGPDGRPTGTSRSATVFVDADDFRAENVTFENTAGRDAGQALAVNVSGDRAAFRRCRFVGWQDTVLLNHNRQYLGDCYVAGHVDFIFGEATAFFDRCHIHCRAAGYITAASTPKGAGYGLVFRDCKVTADAKPGTVYLGRPWRPYGSVTFVNADLPEAIHSAGWDNWRNPANETTARFAESGSTGPGGKPDGRVSWATRLAEKEAKALTPKAVLGGKDGWDPTADARPLVP